eukprot:SAG31_NODE_2619_length_5365_cov_3.812002_2_plen_1415_part_00
MPRADRYGFRLLPRAMVGRDASPSSCSLAAAALGWLALVGSRLCGVANAEILCADATEASPGCAEATASLDSSGVLRIDDPRWTEMSQWAFRGNEDVTAVEIGAGANISVVGDGAFSGCANLVSVELGDSVTTIGREAFRGCVNLVNVTLSPQVTTIGSEAFRDCVKLNLALPASVSALGTEAIRGVHNVCGGSPSLGLPICGRVLCFHTLPDDAPGSCAEARALIDSSGTVRIDDPWWTDIGSSAFRGNENVTAVEIAAGANISVVGAFSFFGCANLVSVELGDSVTKIWSYAFRQCVSLLSVTFGPSVRMIGKRAFAECHSLPSVTLGQGVINVGIGAFEACDSLTSVTMGPSVERIEFRAFLGCRLLSRVTFGPTVKIISQAFGECSQLSLALPPSVTDLHSSTITDVRHVCGGSPLLGLHHCTPETLCPNATKANPGCADASVLVNVDGVVRINDPRWASVGNFAFYGNQEVTAVEIGLGGGLVTMGDHAFDNCSNLVNVTIGQSVTTIGDFAFRCCGSGFHTCGSSLAHVALGPRVTTIGSQAFFGCSQLMKPLALPASVTALGLGALEGVPNVCGGHPSLGLPSCDYLCFYKRPDGSCLAPTDCCAGISDRELLHNVIPSLVTEVQRQHRDSPQVVSAGPLLAVVGSISSQMASTIPVNTTVSVPTEAFLIEVRKTVGVALKNATIGNGCVDVPESVFENLPAGVPPEVSTAVVQWNNMDALGSADATSPVAAMSVTFFEAGGEEIELGNLSLPILLRFTVRNSSLEELAQLGCYFWDSSGAWAFDGVPVQTDAVVVCDNLPFESSRECRTEHKLTCHAHHLTDFALVHNDFGTASELFSLSAWAKNLTGLVAVLVLLGLSIGMLAWSFCRHQRQYRGEDTAVGLQNAAATMYARALLASGYSLRTNAWFCRLLNRVVFKIRSGTICHLFCSLKGDPFLRSQRLVIVLVSMLCSLFFITLFFNTSMDPICGIDTDKGQRICRTYSSCPSASMDLCQNFVPGTSSTFDACELRPFVACKTIAGQFVDPILNMEECEAEGELVRFTADSAGACTEIATGLHHTVAAALLSAVCTVVSMMLVDGAFSSLRAPINRAIAGERRHLWLRCFSAGHNEGVDGSARGHQQAPRRCLAIVSAQYLATHEPQRLRRKTTCWAVAVHCFVLCIAVTCVALTALVVVRFDNARTQSWLLSATISVVTSWFQEPLKAAVKEAALALVMKLLSRRMETRRIMRSGTRVAQLMSRRASTTTPATQGDSLVVEDMEGAEHSQAQRIQSDKGKMRVVADEGHLTFEAAQSKLFNMGFVSATKTWLEGAWTAFDVDSNGVLDAMEFRKLVAMLRLNFAPLDKDAAFKALTKQLGLTVSRDFFLGVWHMYDADGSGFLEAEEFEKLVRALRREEEKRQQNGLEAPS